jgi:hypothetical protein
MDPKAPDTRNYRESGPSKSKRFWDSCLTHCPDGQATQQRMYEVAFVSHNSGSEYLISLIILITVMPIETHLSIDIIV